MSYEEPETPRGFQSGSKMSVGCQAVLWIFGGLAVLALAVFFLMPPLARNPESARRSPCKNNLKQIGLALHDYHIDHGCFPPAYIADADGKPMHSWRVLILPYIDQAPLYQQYDFNEPWDGPNNRLLWSQVPQVYQCPSHVPTTPERQQTVYVTIRDPESLFPGGEAMEIADARDGTSNTLAVAEVSHHPVHWMSPEDISRTDYLADISEATGPHHHEGGSHILMADGAVRFFPAKSVGLLESLITRDGGETVGDF